MLKKFGWRGIWRYPLRRSSFVIHAPAVKFRNLWKRSCILNGSLGISALAFLLRSMHNLFFPGLRTSVKGLTWLAWSRLISLIRPSLSSLFISSDTISGKRVALLLLGKEVLSCCRTLGFQPYRMILITSSSKPNLIANFQLRPFEYSTCSKCWLISGFLSGEIRFFQTLVLRWLFTPEGVASWVEVLFLFFFRRRLRTPFRSLLLLLVLFLRTLSLCGCLGLLLRRATERFGQFR